MYEFTESIVIEVDPKTVWERLIDIESWWPDSNPEHASLERLDERVGVGTRLRIRERVAGVPGEAVGEITEFEPLSAVTWEAPEARYRLLGMTVTVGEGVTWSMDAADGGATRVSARVWAVFFDTAIGRAQEWMFAHVLNGVERDREHTRTELRYLKQLLESEAPTRQKRDSGASGTTRTG